MMSLLCILSLYNIFRNMQLHSTKWLNKVEAPENNQKLIKDISALKSS